jgi:hypothetical protein
LHVCSMFVPLLSGKDFGNLIRIVFVDYLVMVNTNKKSTLRCSLF